MKMCRTCDIEKPESEYYSDGKGGRNNECKECNRRKARERYTPVKKKVKECKNCGHEFRGNNAQKYCAPECRDEYHNSRDRTYQIVCKGCGEEKEVSSHSAEYCSHDCYYEYGDHSMKGTFTIDIICETCGILFEADSNVVKYCDAHHPSKWPQTKIKITKCEHCCTIFTSVNGKKYCTEECSSEAQKIKLIQNNIRNGYYDKVCKECGDVFNRLWVDHNHRDYCSEQCYELAVKRWNYRSRSGKDYRSRANKFGVYYESIDKIEIFERDDWICQECGIKTPRQLAKTNTNEGNEPTLDHIIPMSCGGPHSKANVQLLCRECNVNKSNAYEGQLSII